MEFSHYQLIKVNIPSAIFTIHRHIPSGKWFHKKNFDDKKPLKNDDENSIQENK
jgi:hypothetical protein